MVFDLFFYYVTVKTIYTPTDAAPVSLETYRLYKILYLSIIQENYSAEHILTLQENETAVENLNFLLKNIWKIYYL